MTETRIEEVKQSLLSAARTIEILQGDLKQARMELIGQQMLIDQLHEQLTVVSTGKTHQLRVVQ